ncbi:hypothetical protein QFZ23_001943 [Arthrobacter globiformis]|uniref:hypothetical protein n=1 Tax=Arthrobacter globiformis TaxID=1665 RepID=UPI00277DC377|nr:hypothetical protein [Arthrobacter globiformis]MDQ1058042.1 hypothetical protein [Arthrobacter globiformis]
MEHAWAQHMLFVIEHAIDALATGPERIQQRLADAYQYSGLAEQVAPDSELPPTILALQLDLQAAMETVHDAERGQAVASAFSLSDDQCIIFVRRILAAERELRELWAQHEQR